MSNAAAFVKYKNDHGLVPKRRPGHNSKDQGNQNFRPLRSKLLSMLSSRALFLVISLLRPVQSALLPRGSAAVYLTTRYWDCCKPSCSWPNFAPVTNPVTTCNIDDEPYSVEDGENAESSCLNGDTSGAFQCSSQQPWAVSDTLAYGFVAVSGSINESDTCCQCYS